MFLKLSNQSLKRDKAYIDGCWVKADSAETFPVNNPFDDSVIANVAYCGKEETERAIGAAQAAFDGWKKISAKDRFTLLMKWHDLIVENADDLAMILTSEQGKPLAEAKGEVLYGASYIQWFAEEAKRIYGDTITGAANRIVIIKQPVGVVGCITPWNFPNAMLARKLAPALAAGNTVVCKPANETPLSAFAIAQLADQAGIPAGVINIVAGQTSEIGAALTSSPIVRKLTFTGSTQVGKLLMEQCAGTLKRTSMELGGNAPFIVFDDADLDAAVDGLMASKFRNSGQTCVCSNRIFVQRDIYDAFLLRIQKAVAELKLGAGYEQTTTVGPLINQKAAQGVCKLIAGAVSQGATLSAGSDQCEGNFVKPSILSNVTSDMDIFHSEIFGPVISLIRFETEDEVITQANDTPYGLAAYFFSRDIGRVWRVSEALEYGMIGINTGRTSSERLPFGGIKESGQGREGSKYGLDDYLEIKSLTMGGLDI